MATRKPKILIFDIETTDINANIGFIAVIAWKWLGEKTEHRTILDYKTAAFDPVYADKALCDEFRSVLDEADMWVTWYGLFHDEPFLRTRFLFNDLLPFADCAHFDGWQVAVKRFKLSRNSLQGMFDSMYFGEGDIKNDKCPVHIHHWIRARIGDPIAIGKISEKCRSDVEKLDVIYKRLAPYSGGLLPNLTFDKDNPQWRAICVSCYGTKVTKYGVRYKDNKIFQRYKCNTCGGDFLGKLN